MAKTFNGPSNLDQLVGLWEFSKGEPGADSGLDDGKAQDGVFNGGAFAAHDRLITDGHGDFFDVEGKDAPFDLDAGTLEVQFTQRPSHRVVARYHREPRRV